MLQFIRIKRDFKKYHFHALITEKWLNLLIKQSVKPTKMCIKYPYWCGKLTLYLYEKIPHQKNQILP